MIKLNWKKDNQWKRFFPIFDKHPEIVYLDNAASTQKPKAVIDWISDFLKNDYANIHRGLYSLSEKSEELYYESKCALAKLINCKPSEIIVLGDQLMTDILGANLSGCYGIYCKQLQEKDTFLTSINRKMENFVWRHILHEEV